MVDIPFLELSDPVVVVVGSVAGVVYIPLEESVDPVVGVHLDIFEVVVISQHIEVVVVFFLPRPLL